MLVSEWPMRAGLQLLSYLRRLCLRVASAAVESRLCMSSGALPGPDHLRVMLCLKYLSTPYLSVRGEAATKRHTIGGRS